MTSEEINSIKEIEGTGGFRVMKFVIEQKMKVLDSVSDVEENNLVNVEAVFLGKKYAVKLLREFLSDMSLTTKPQEEKRKTYE